MNDDHTQGPWVKDGFALYSDILSVNKKHIARVFSRDCESPEEFNANIQLITAAPEMLDVLKWLDNEMNTRDDEFGGCLFSHEDFKKVRALINKLTRTKETEE